MQNYLHAERTKRDILRQRILLLLFLGFCMTVNMPKSMALMCEQSGIKTNWSPDMYEKYDWQKFFGYKAANEEIDLKNIDYPLLNAAIFYVTNFHREKHNLPLLSYNEKLGTSAEGHSQDMVQHNFFSHESPVDGKNTLSERIKAADAPKYFMAAENIAQNHLFDYSAGRGYFGKYNAAGVPEFRYSNGEKIKVHTYLSLAKALLSQWMKSQGHRKNILDKQFTHLGCGAAVQKRENDVSFEKVFATQVFLKLMN